MGIIEFAINSMMELNPGYTLFIFTALYFLFFNKQGRTYNIIGWIFISVFLVFIFNNGKPYYMGVLFPVMLSAGIVGADHLIHRYTPRFVRVVLVILVILFAFIVTPFAVPILNVDSFINYSKALGVTPKNAERSELGLLPQFYSDRFGWEQMVKEVAITYNKLSDEEKKEALIFGQNYGGASTVNFYRKKYNLPPAISAHNNYWIWGYPENYKGNVLIIIGSNYKDNSEFFEDVEFVVRHSNKYGMPFENVDIFICRKPKMPISEIWDRIKSFI